MISLFALLLLGLAASLSAKMQLSATTVRTIIHTGTSTDLRRQFFKTDEEYLTAQQIVYAIITGNSPLLEREIGKLTPTAILPTAPIDTQNLFSSARRKLITFVATKAPALQECARTLLPPFTTGGIVSSVAQSCMKAFAATHTYYQNEREREHLQELDLQRFPLLRISHDYAFDIFIKLLFILHSSQARSCDRMAALFLINHCTILGKRARIMKHYIARLNRYYFSPSGHLLSYDPPQWTYRDRFIKKLQRFLMMVSDSKQQYLNYLCTGIGLGISELAESYSHQLNREWSQRRPHTIRCYANSFLQALTGGKLSFSTSIQPFRIQERTITRSFMSLISLSLFNTTLGKKEKEEAAAHIIEKCRLSAPLYAGYLESFFKELTLAQKTHPVITI